MKPTEQQPLVYFENAAGRLLEDPAGFIRANWSGSTYGLADVRGLFTHMMLGLQRRGWSRILINQLTMRPFTHQEQEWIAQKWLPQAVSEGGYRHGAVVVSPEVMVRLATAYITTQSQSLAITYRSFETDAAAQAWLLQQPSSPLKY
ncbi:hypothetical protein MUN84_10965 [Hymenobacter sp. 5516J-16]|uniref:STAS/SEC14 domain-containing protein n=1 Tax=Hymenobacter sublimis TaxID=2933777 RepID=A0ABY4J807_9BACT|nr:MULTISPECIES: hypothetical protein [Hymenobacter]UOQ78990.1 hypothetical protein MUN84_10965 [Hymenobacter sp. 5516J-16]UPL48936.1 hypothetical protein MWH26_17330 [Hymenobacter sublimis]